MITHTNKHTYIHTYIHKQKEGKLEDIGKPTAAIVTMILALEGRKVAEV